MAVILETSRLILRHQVIEDLDDLFPLYQDPEIRKYFPDGVKNYEDAKEELEWFMNGHHEYPELGFWATIHKETGKFIGRCGLFPWTIDGQLEIEVAYLLDRNYWHQGLATEALRERLDSRMTESERVEYDQSIARLHAMLPEAEFNALWAEGRSMTMEQAIKLAIG